MSYDEDQRGAVQRRSFVSANYLAALPASHRRPDVALGVSRREREAAAESGQHKAAEITRDEAHAARRWSTRACSSATIEDENDADERRVILASPQREEVIVIPPRKMRLSPHRFMRRWFKFTSVQILATIACLVIFNAVQAGAQSLANSFFTEPDTHPGFYSRVSQRGLDLMANYLGQRVSKLMRLGAVFYNLTVPLTPLVRFTLVSGTGTTFDASSFRSQMNVTLGKEILWTGHSLKLTVPSTYRLTSSAGDITGVVPVTFEKAFIELGMVATVNADGHLKTDLSRCRVTLSELHFEFSRTDADLMHNYIPFIHRAVRENIDNLLCPIFHTELMPVVSNRLMNTPMSAALFDHYFINYGLVGPVGYGPDGIELRHRGNVFGILRQGRTRLNDFRLPFKSAPLRVVEDKHMVTFQMSNYTLASLLFWMDQYRRFDYEISKTSVNDSNIAGYLRTECGVGDICAGTLFPALAQRFSQGVVNIKTHTVTFPHVRLEQGKVVVVVDSRIDAFVSQPDRNRRFLTASMLAQISLQKTSFKDYTLKGSLSIDSFKISDVVSLVEGIDAGSIEFLINALNELIIADDIAKKLKEAIGTGTVLRPVAFPAHY
ncbi:Protein C06G1.1 a [Aphelenchoides avenae]|nr:Protein C06G1.1 a [Aphelenchus avenae]